VQRVSALEDLQVAWLQVQRAYERAVPVEHGLDAGVVLVGRRAQMWAEFELASRFSVLDRKGDGVVVGVEVPGETVSFIGSVDNHVGQRVGVTEEVLLAECFLDKRRERWPFVDRA